MKNMLKREWPLFLLSCLIVLLFFWLPPLGGMTESAMLLLGIFLGSVLLWITAGISWPSLFCLMMLLLVPEMSVGSIVSTSFGNPAITFLILTFCCSYTLNQTPFTRRCAIWFLSTPLARKGPWWFLCLYFLSVLALGSCMSTTVIVLIYLTINEEIFSLLGLEKGHKLAALMTMGLVIVASISGAMTPIAHVFPLMALSICEGITGEAVSYGTYLAAGIPTALLTTAALLLIFRFVLKPDVEPLRKADVRAMQKALPKIEKREGMTVSIFFLVVALWVLPDLLKGVFPVIGALSKRFGTVGPPLLGALLMCVIRPQGKPLMQFPEALKSVPWPSLFMAAAALSLGSAMTNADIGLSEWVKTAIGPMAQSLQGFSLAVVLVIITLLLTNVGSNMVTVTIASTVGIPIALSLGGVQQALTLAIVVGMASSYAFATPPAMTTVVLGTGSGWTTNAQMAKYGFLTLIPTALAICLVALPIASMLE